MLGGKSLGVKQEEGEEVVLESMMVPPVFPRFWRETEDNHTLTKNPCYSELPLSGQVNPGGQEPILCDKLTKVLLVENVCES